MGKFKVQEFKHHWIDIYDFRDYISARNYWSLMLTRYPNKAFRVVLVTDFYYNCNER